MAFKIRIKMKINLLSIVFMLILLIGCSGKSRVDTTQKKEYKYETTKEEEEAINLYYRAHNVWMGPPEMKTLMKAQVMFDSAYSMLGDKMNPDAFMYMLMTNSDLEDYEKCISLVQNRDDSLFYFPFEKQMFTSMYKAKNSLLNGDTLDYDKHYAEAGMCVWDNFKKYDDKSVLLMLFKLRRYFHDKEAMIADMDSLGKYAIIEDSVLRGFNDVDVIYNYTIKDEAIHRAALCWEKGDTIGMRRQYDIAIAYVKEQFRKNPGYKELSDWDFVKTMYFRRYNAKSFLDDLDSIQKLKVLPDSVIEHFREINQDLLNQDLLEGYLIK